MNDADDPREPRSDETAGSVPSASRLLVRTWSDGEAILVRQLLSSYGIPCQVVSDVPHSVFPLSVDGLGEIRIFVPEIQADEARQVLADHLRNGLEVVDGGKAEGGAADGSSDPSGQAVNGPRSEP